MLGYSDYRKIRVQCVFQLKLINNPKHVPRPAGHDKILSHGRRLHARKSPRAEMLLALACDVIVGPFEELHNGGAIRSKMGRMLGFRWKSQSDCQRKNYAHIVRYVENKKQLKTQTRPSHGFVLTIEHNRLRVASH